MVGLSTKRDGTGLVGLFGAFGDGEEDGLSDKIKKTRAKPES